jgi:hypothetical protein
MMTPRRQASRGSFCEAPFAFYVVNVLSWQNLISGGDAWQSFTHEHSIVGKPNKTMIRKEMGARIGEKVFACVSRRLLALLLLFAVTGLSTIAKINWYLPQSDPGHYLTTATKMKVADSHTTFTIGSLQPARELLLSLPQEPAMFLEERREISIPPMLLTAILLLRSPPSESA